MYCRNKWELERIIKERKVKKQLEQKGENEAYC